MADAQMVKYIYDVDTKKYLRPVNIADDLRNYYTPRTHRDIRRNAAGSLSVNHGITHIHLDKDETKYEIVNKIRDSINPNTLCYVHFGNKIIGIYLVTDIPVEKDYVTLVSQESGFRTKRSRKSKSPMRKKRSRSKKAKLPIQKKKSRS